MKVIPCLCLANGKSSHIDGSENGPLNHTALYWSCDQGRVDLVKDLLRLGASWCISSNTGWTPLHAACFRGHADVVCVLLNSQQGKTMLETKDHFGKTPLHVACFAGGNEAVLRALLSRGATVHTADHTGATPLHCVAEAGSVALITAMAYHQKSKVACILNALDQYGHTPLHRACQRGHVTAVCKLLDLGAALDGFPRCTPLQTACTFGHLSVVEALVRNGASIEARDHHGNTALHWSCRSGHARIVQRLLGRGAHVDVVNAQGQTALDVARYYRRSVVVAVLLQHATLLLDLVHYAAGDWRLACVKQTLEE